MTIIAAVAVGLREPCGVTIGNVNRNNCLKHSVAAEPSRKTATDTRHASNKRSEGRRQTDCSHPLDSTPGPAHSRPRPRTGQGGEPFTARKQWIVWIWTDDVRSR
jgi:hypothetical protein